MLATASRPIAMTRDGARANRQRKTAMSMPPMNIRRPLAGWRSMLAETMAPTRPPRPDIAARKPRPEAPWSKTSSANTGRSCWEAEERHEHAHEHEHAEEAVARHEMQAFDELLRE